MKNYAIKKGISEDKILTENTSIDTKENAKFSLDVLKRFGYKKIILVTSPFHQRRAYKIFEKTMRSEHIDILNYAADSQEWNEFIWFLSFRNVKLLFMEIRLKF